MLVNILIGLGVVAVVLAVLMIIVALRPGDFRISRTAVIEAPASEVFEQVNDFQKWRDWSPYDRRDPEMKRTYEGPPEGVGASYAWNGNSNVGEGRSTITESIPNQLIRIRLEFIRPFSGTNTAEFTFEPRGDQTAVTWSIIGKNNFMSKAMSLVINMDKMIGGDFEQGLANLKSVVEAVPQP